MNDKLEELIRAYNMGYKAGHHDTVEGGYVHIFECDMGTYHDDEVREIIKQQEEV